MPRTRTALITLASCALVVAPSAAWDKEGARAAAAAATRAYSETTFLAHVPLGRNVHYYVLPDGSPATKAGKKQGRGPGASTLQFGDGVKVGQGETGAGITVYALKDKIMVGFNRKRGATLNPTMVHILFDRETTADDFDSHDIARAVSGLVEIRGFEPGRALAEMLDQAAAEAVATEAQASADPEKPSLTGPTVVSLSVTAEPAAVRAGDNVRLILSYELAGGNSIRVLETRILELEGATIPTFPVAEELTNAAGAHTTAYEQSIPATAKPGRYTFTGEVCVGGDCIRRSTAFDVN